MIFPSMDKLETWGSKFALVTLAAKRAKQLKGGAPPLIDTDSRNPLTIALEEIAAGKVTCVVSDADIVIQTSVEPEVAELLAIPIEPEEEAEIRAEDLFAPDVEPAAAVDEVVAGTETEEEAEEEEIEEEEEVDEWHAALDEETAGEEHPLQSEEGVAAGGIEPDIAELAEPSIEGDQPKPKARRGRKPRAEVADLTVDSPLLDDSAEESDEDAD